MGKVCSPPGDDSISQAVTRAVVAENTAPESPSWRSYGRLISRECVHRRLQNPGNTATATNSRWRHGDGRSITEVEVVRAQAHRVARVDGSQVVVAASDYAEQCQLFRNQRTR
jgi:hypothetical protein